MRYLVGGVFLSSLLIVSCSDSEEPVLANVEWALSCPQPPNPARPCGSLGDTCLSVGGGGDRQIFQFNGADACPDDDANPGRVVATCVGVEREDTVFSLNVEASVADLYGFEVRGLLVNVATNAVIPSDGCNVTIIEDGQIYDQGACGIEAPSEDQPCQISQLFVDQRGEEISMLVACSPIISSVGTEFDVGGPEGGPASVVFENCDGF